MRDARRIGAFFSGLMLYCAAVGCGFMLARVSLPQAFYNALGGRESLATVLVEASAIALLLFLMALVWSYFTVRPRARSRHTTTAWCLSGLGMAWLGWLIYGTVHFAMNPQGYQQSVSALLLAADVPPLWGLLNVIAVVGGAVLAGVLAKPAPSAARAAAA